MAALKIPIGDLQRKILELFGTDVTGVGGGGVKVTRPMAALGAAAMRGAPRALKALKGLALAGGGAVATKIASKIGSAGPAASGLAKVAAGGAAFGGGSAAVEQLLAGGGEIVRGGGGRRSGLSARDLKGFNKVVKLLKKVGMRPKALGAARSRSRRCR